VTALRRAPVELPQVDPPPAELPRVGPPPAEVPRVDLRELELELELAELPPVDLGELALGDPVRQRRTADLFPPRTRAPPVPCRYGG
jgi:hypothetical protein